jgi:hypothetical protein
MILAFSELVLVQKTNTQKGKKISFYLRSILLIANEISKKTQIR